MLLGLPPHKCESCGREFIKQRGLKIHMARWCDGGHTQRSRRGSLTDIAVKTAKRRAAEATLDNVSIGNDVLENVLTFEYLGSRLQCDGDDQVDVRHRERRGSAVVSTSACHAGGRGSLPGPDTLLGVKTWLSTLEIVYLCVFRMRH